MAIITIDSSGGMTILVEIKDRIRIKENNMIKIKPISSYSCGELIMNENKKVIMVRGDD